MKGRRWCSQKLLEADVLDQDQLVVLLGEQLPEVDAGVLVEPLEDLGVHPGDAVGRLQEPFAVGVLAHGDEDLADGPADPGEVDGLGPASLGLSGAGMAGRNLRAGGAAVRMSGR